jgi:hypothetical protein
MQESFVIDQVSWHTSVPGNPETREHIVRRFYTVVVFLQTNALVVRRLLDQENEIDDDFAINSADLTEEGLAVMRAAYDKWLQKVDKGMDPADMSLFDRALKRIRGR